MLLCVSHPGVPSAQKAMENSDLASRLSPGRDRGTAVLLVGSGSLPKVFRARKTVLAANSSVFRQMWSDAVSEPHCVSVPDVDPEAFTVLLRYWYTGDVQVNAVQTAFRVLHAAKKYQADALADHCRRFLAAAVNVSTACAVLDKAREVNESSLVEACCSILRNHTSAVIQHDTFLEASSMIVSELLDEDFLNVHSELELIRAVDRWSEAECQRRDLPLDPSGKRRVAGPLLHKIVFLSLTAQEFISEKCTRHLLTADEYRDILANIVELGSCPMPAGFSDKLSRSCRSCVKGRILSGKVKLTYCPNCKKNSCCLLSKTYNARRCHLCHVVVL